MSKGNECNANGHRRRKLRARVKAMGLPCAICGEPIDYGLPAGHDRSFELDEIVGRWLGGDPLDPANVQPVHRECNRLKYQRERGIALETARKAPKPVRASRRW